MSVTLGRRAAGGPRGFEHIAVDRQFNVGPPSATCGRALGTLYGGEFHPTGSGLSASLGNVYCLLRGVPTNISPSFALIRNF